LGRVVTELLRREGVTHRPVVVPDRSADWTLMLTSGPHGDKLPIGFRGCHAAAGPRLAAEASGFASQRPGLVVVAGLDNATAAGILGAFPDSARFLAPSLRGMKASEPSPGALAGLVDVLACNREEWQATPPADRIALQGSLSLLAVTEGPRGATIGARGEDGAWFEVRVPAFPRAEPPRDTNRAGEAFGSTLVRGLLDVGWRPGRPLDSAAVRRVAVRASAASALVLDLERFGFADDRAVDAALRAGAVGSGPGEGSTEPRRAEDASLS
jgi:ribokinase